MLEQRAKVSLAELLFALALDDLEEDRPDQRPGKDLQQQFARRARASRAAYLNVRLEKNSEMRKRNPMDLFRAAVKAWPEVVECAAFTCEMDYLLRAAVQDLARAIRASSCTSC